MSGHRATLGYHARMLCDPWRMDGYERAIRALVRPGDVVLDLGTGTGILAMLAARRGARVHAVESMGVARIASQLVAHNNLDVTVHRTDICKLDPIEPVDLVVSDFLGCFLVDDNMLPAVEAAGRWLKPGGRFCPGEVRLYVGPVGDFTLSTVEIWREPFYGLDLAPVEAEALRVTSLGNLHPANLLAAPEPFATFVPPGVSQEFDHRLRFTTTRRGRLRALAGWFEAQMAPGVTLSTAPGHETHWGQFLFPVPERDLEVGTVIEARLVYAYDRWIWSGTIGGEAFELEESLAA